MKYMDIKPAPADSLEHYKVWRENLAADLSKLSPSYRKIEVKNG